MKTGWYLIRKSFKGGGNKYAFRVTKKIIEEYGEWNELFEYIGEHTNGGHCYGYRITSKHQKSKPVAKKGEEKIKTLRFKKVQVIEERLVSN